MPAPEPADPDRLSSRPAQRRVASAYVAAQAVLMVLLVVPLPGGRVWVLPAWAVVVCIVVGVVGLGVMVVGGSALGRGLTASPMPNDRAELRTGGMYRYVRHPMYSGTLLAGAALVVWSGSLVRLGVLVALGALFTVKARWEEQRLAQTFDGYADYARRTPRFVPRARVGQR